MSSNNEDEQSRNGNATMSSDSESAEVAAAAATPRLQLNGRGVHVDSLVSAPDPPPVVPPPSSMLLAGSRLIFSPAASTATATSTTSSSTTSSNADNNDNAATAAANDNNTDNNDEIDTLMETFFSSYTTWKMHVDLMVKLEDFLLDRRQQHPELELLPEATATGMNNDDNDVVLPPMQVLLKLLKQEQKAGKEAAKKMSGTGGDGWKVYDGNKLVSSYCTEDGAEDDVKLPSTDSTRTNDTTSVPSSSPSASTLLSLEELSKTLFQPGMQFRGRISIPGLLGGGGQLQHDDSMEEEGDDDDNVDDEEEDEDSIYCLGDMEDMYRDDGPEDEEEMERLRRFNAYAGEEVEEEKEEVVMAEEEEAVMAEEEEGVMAEEVVVDVEEQEGNNNSNGDRLASHNANQVLEREGVSDDPAAAAAADDDPTANRESVTNSQHGLSGIPYELTVLQCGTDPLGNDYIQAKHSAYDDEQVGSISLR